jgi:hypothetical protein
MHDVCQLSKCMQCVVNGVAIWSRAMAEVWTTISIALEVLGILWSPTIFTQAIFLSGKHIGRCILTACILGPLSNVVLTTN